MQEALDRLPTVVMGAVRRLLRPLVRLMIRHGITLPSIVELLKQVMVEVAIEDFPVVRQAHHRQPGQRAYRGSPQGCQAFP